MTPHVAIHMWGAWAALPFFVAGTAYGRVLIRGLVAPRGSWAELRDVLSILIPTMVGLVILLFAVFEYGA